MPTNKEAAQVLAHPNGQRCELTQIHNHILLHAVRFGKVFCKTCAVMLALLGLAALELAAAWRRGKRPALASIPAMLAPAAGLGLYFGLNQAVYGRWNQYSVYQWEHWGQKLGLFTNTVRYHLDYMASWWEDNRKAAVGICLAAILCILLALGLLAASVRRLPAAWLGFGLAYLAVTMGATWLLSAPRYAVGLFCLPVALALLLQDRPRLTCGVLAVQVMVSVVYTWQYLHGWPIY